LTPLLLLPQYIDPIVQATFNQDGALQEIVRTLSLRMRDANTTVGFPVIFSPFLEHPY
jgi:hypothetical protein